MLNICSIIRQSVIQLPLWLSALCYWNNDNRFINQNLSFWAIWINILLQCEIAIYDIWLRNHLHVWTKPYILGTLPTSHCRYALRALYITRLFLWWSVLKISPFIWFCVESRASWGLSQRSNVLLFHCWYHMSISYSLGSVPSNDIQFLVVWAKTNNIKVNPCEGNTHLWMDVKQQEWDELSWAVWVVFRKLLACSLLSEMYGICSTCCQKTKLIQ